MCSVRQRICQILRPAFLVAFVITGHAGAQAPKMPEATTKSSDAAVRFDALFDEASAAYMRGTYVEGTRAAERALAIARESFGPHHQFTPVIMNLLAILYERQARFDEAEELYREALQLSREVLGLQDPDTLSIMNNLADLYTQQGRYREAEPMLREALRLLREALGPRDPQTLTSMNNLAILYAHQGRYGEAEPLHREALQISRETLGLFHLSTLGSWISLANIFDIQGRYGEAEPLYREALPLYRERFGEQHPTTLLIRQNWAKVLERQGRYGEAEPLYREALQIFRKVHGLRHPTTASSMARLGRLEMNQGRYVEAEPLYLEALQIQRGSLPPGHRDTLASIGNLAVLYALQGRHADAEPLHREALLLSREALGPRHPITLVAQLRSVQALAALGRLDDATRQLRTIGPHILGWLGNELYTNEAASTRREMVASQARYQHVAISLALLPGAGPQAAEAAASAVLRLKGLQAEEEAYIGRMVRRGADPRVQDLARDIAGFRRQLARLSSGGGQPAQVAALTAQLEANELALGRLSRDYQQHLQVRAFNLDDLWATLPPRTALLEIREYEPFDFSAYQFGAPRWAGLLLSGNGTQVVDLGPVEGTQARVAALLADVTGPAGIEAATTLQVHLLGPLAAELAGLERLYVAPDGVLNLVPFAALRGPDGKRLAESLDLRLLLTGRDLLRPDADRPAQGLLALGGIDFDEAAPVQPTNAGQSADPLFGGIGAGELRQRTAAAPRSSFTPLPATAAEVTVIAQQYRAFRPDEPAPELWEGSGASEARLKALQRPPRVLHLATHAFNRNAIDSQNGPMLLSGLALAGANQALAGTTEDGILYAIEAQDLNLEGTELVVLSASETAGRIHYGMGLSGLVSALRIAGARYVLVTLTQVNDQAAAAYIQRFYHQWLSQPGRSDPAAALRAAQREAIADNERLATANQIWAQFVLIGG